MPFSRPVCATEANCPTMQAKTIQQPADPNLAIQQQQAQQEQLKALQTQASGDTAALMARYGTKLALAGMSSPSTPNSSSNQFVGKV